MRRRRALFLARLSIPRLPWLVLLPLCCARADAGPRARAGNWHEEQIDELFASLLGRAFAQDGGASTAPDVALDPALDDVAPARAGEIEVGSLRLI